MDGPNQIAVEAYVEQMRRAVEDTLRRVAAAVNDAPDGAWINDSEWPVFDAFADLRRLAFERALQMRADAAASAFSPGGRRERSADAQQG